MPLLQYLLDNYQNLQEEGFTHRKFSYQQVLPLIKDLTHYQIFKVEVVGYSELKQAIFSVKFGSGKKKIMLWAQMHGNESTATMALLDFFSFYKNTESELKAEWQKLFETFTFSIIPVVNPDGMNAWTRENAYGIDINRDSMALQSAEGKILMNEFQSFKPDYAFNLHDQRNVYGVGNSKSPATISFLAPSFNFEKSINGNRKEAMQLIYSMFDFLENKLKKNHTALYDDEFYPTSFGDNFQKQGAATVLIESGGHFNDAERQIARYWNVLLYFQVFESIMDKTHLNFSTDNYFSIPTNSQRMLDIIVRDVGYKHMTVDIGISSATSNAFSGTDELLIEKIGDLSNFGAYEEIDAKGLKLSENDEAQLKLNAKAQIHLSRNGTDLIKIKAGIRE